MALYPRLCASQLGQYHTGTLVQTLTPQLLSLFSPPYGKGYKSAKARGEHCVELSYFDNGERAQATTAPPSSLVKAEPWTRGNSLSK